MNIINERLSHDFTARPRLQVGQVLDLIYEDSAARSRIRKFTGICIATTRIGFGFRHTLRNVINNVCIELSIDSHSTVVVYLAKAPLYKELSSRRAKLYYLRAKRSVDSKV